jgi:hypothetical protein
MSLLTTGLLFIGLFLAAAVALMALALLRSTGREAPGPDDSEDGER